MESDHSKKVCGEIGRLLESSLLAYLNRFPKVQRPKHVVHVLVFANRESFIAYAGELGEDLTRAAGAYKPISWELRLYVPSWDPDALRNNAQHECFHAFMHEFAEDVPRWFDEGYAQYFGQAYREGDRLRLGSVDRDALKTLRASRSVTRERLETLMGLDHAGFMAEAGFNYALSWALVHFLEETMDGKLRLLNRTFFESLRNGESPEEARRRIYHPVMEHLATGFARHLASLSDYPPHSPTPSLDPALLQPVGVKDRRVLDRATYEQTTPIVQKG